MHLNVWLVGVLISRIVHRTRLVRARHRDWYAGLLLLPRVVVAVAGIGWLTNDRLGIGHLGLFVLERWWRRANSKISRAASEQSNSLAIHKITVIQSRDSPCYRSCLRRPPVSSLDSRSPLRPVFSVCIYHSRSYNRSSSSSRRRSRSWRYSRTGRCISPIWSWAWSRSVRSLRQSVRPSRDPDCRRCRRCSSWSDRLRRCVLD